MKIFARLWPVCLLALWLPFAVPGLRAAEAGRLDPGFDPGAGPDDVVRTIAVQPDGAILIGGEFLRVDGVPSPKLARLGPDGRLDQAFAARVAALFDPAGGRVSAVAIQPDGRIVVAGSFFLFNGRPRFQRNLVRLESDGQFDLGFERPADSPNNAFGLALQPDGGVLVLGDFASTFRGLAASELVRINPDGSPDAGFVPAFTGDLSKAALLVQPDGRILIGGRQFGRGGTVLRLNPNGKADSGFAPPLQGPDTPSAVALALQPDGRLIYPGLGATIAGFLPVRRVLRAASDGTPDEGFNTRSPLLLENGDPLTGIVRALAVDSAGRVLLAGAFTECDGVARGRVARLLADGSLDAAFDPGAGAEGSRFVDAQGRRFTQVLALAVQADGAVLIGGDFTSYDGVARPYLARLSAGPPLVSVEATVSRAVAGGEKGLFTVRRTGAGSTGELRVRLKVGGSAVAGVGYRPLGGEIVLPTGRTEAKVKVKALGTAPVGTVKLTVLAGEGYTVNLPASAKVKLIGAGG